MHPDAGAVIGISLAGSVLLVALIFLCLLNLPCCKESFKPASSAVRNGGNRSRNVRPSTSSQATILNLPFSGSTRSLHTLSALDLHNQNIQNQSNYLSGSSGLVNPLWQMQCHSCGSLVTASQHNLNHHHHCSNSLFCHCYHHPDEQARNIATAAGHSPNALASTSSSFQYGSPQLLPSTESPPPPYSPSRLAEPSTGSNNMVEEINVIASASNSQSRQPSCSSPKY